MFYPSAAIVSRTTQLSDISSVSYPINPSDIFLVPRPTCPSITPVSRTPGPPITLVFHPRSLFVTAVSY
ncbi:MAG TPA: hypothetical protein VHC96_03875, partial [Puia sp.]|nr:hypothetical protein [Puia sp.]